MTLRRSLLACSLLALVALWVWCQLPSPQPTSKGPSDDATAASASTIILDAAPRPDAAGRSPLAAEPTAPPIATTRLRIDVTLPNGDPAVGASVRAGEREAVTDAQGSAEFAVMEVPQVTASLGALYGEGARLEDWDGDVDRVVVVLAPDVHLAVEVTDPTGVPQEGVRVRVEATVATRRGGVNQPDWSIVTDARGRAELTHLQCQANYIDGIAATVHIRARGAQSTPAAFHLAERRLDWQELAADPKVHLVVPASGTVVVRIAGADRRPVHVDTRIEEADGWRLAAGTEGDVEVFRMVPLGRTWSLRLDRTVVRSLRGPERANEVVRIDVPWNVHSWRFRGRLVLAKGLKCPDIGVAWVALRDPSIPGVDLVKEALCLDQPFELSAYLAHAGFAKLELHVESPIRETGKEQVIVVEGPMHAGDVDLGELELATPPDFVELGTFAAFLDGRDSTQSAQIRICEVRDAEGRLPEETYFPFLVDSRGEVLRLFGRQPAGPLRLDGWIGEGLPFESIVLRLGEHHRIDLRRAASLRVDLARHRVPDDAIVADLIPLHMANAEPERARTQAHTLVWNGVTPGTYTLTIRCGDQVLASERELLLAPGAQRWPADGRALDVRGAQVVHLLARSGNPNGPLRNIGVALATADAADAEALEWHDGWFAPTAAATELLVRSGGYVPMRLPRPTADMELVLQPMTRLQLHARDGEDFQVQVRVVTDGVADALLRAIDREHEHRTDFHSPSEASIHFAPGTELEITRVTGEQPAPVHRAKVTATPMQFVELW